MKIGLVDVDGHAKKKKWGATIYPNLALCKIARYHKQQGDTVEWAFPFEHYDVVYMSKVFNFSPDDMTVYQADRIVRGGTGYDIASRLPDEIDRLQPDYSIYPNIPSDTGPWKQDADELALTDMTPKATYQPSDEINQAIKGATLSWATEKDEKEGTETPAGGDDNGDDDNGGDNGGGGSQDTGGGLEP